MAVSWQRVAKTDDRSQVLRGKSASLKSSGRVCFRFLETMSLIFRISTYQTSDFKRLVIRETITYTKQYRLTCLLLFIGNKENEKN